MNAPIVIENDSFQNCWIESIKFLPNNSWECWNFIINIRNPILFDNNINNAVTTFARSNGLILPKHVAYTIFPHKQYKNNKRVKVLYDRYNNRFYPWTRKRPHRGWGTYFYRMIHYEKNMTIVNQLDNIIKSINSRIRTSKACYNILIQKPGTETIRIRGGPCLNYIAVQMEPGKNRRMSLLCVYRNHDFLERTYGNYWGICNLLKFLAKETNSIIGTLTCISSHAYISAKKTELNQFLRSIDEAT